MQDNIPQEVKQLRLCASLKDCGALSVDVCLKSSMATEISVYDDEVLGYTDWREGYNNSPDVFIVHNNERKNIVLLPLDNRIISGPRVKEGGVADCALLTMTDFCFIEFKTNVTSNSTENIDSKTDDAIKQLWHTYDGIIKPRCHAKGIDIPKMVNLDFFIVFNKELDVTGAMASRQNYQIEFMEEYGFPLFFDNEKNF